MKAIILCPGPSLLRTWRRRKWEPHLTIAINRAATQFDCDVWACGDEPLQQKIFKQVLGVPVLFTASASAAQIRDHGTPWRGKVREFESIDRGRLEHKWDTFTATAALVFAAESGAETVEVHGANWSGEEDFDGVKAGGNRSDARWDLERGIWNRMVSVLGLTVNRVI